jgi:hypothetical protein
MTVRATRTLTALAVALPLLLAACGDDDDDDAASTQPTDAAAATTTSGETVPADAPTSTTAAPSTTTAADGAATTTSAGDTTPTTAAPDDDAPGLDDGRHFGFVSAVDLDARTITFDLAQWLTGEEADAAAEADGVIEPGESVPNDSYVVNDNPRLRVVPLGFDVGVLLIDWPNCCENAGSTLDALAAATDSAGSNETGPRNQPGVTGYWLTLDGGEIVGIEEQYRP